MNVLYHLLFWGTVILLLVGAQLQVLKAALVCPDWPLCFGEFLPMYMTPAFYESLHRFLAGIISLGSVAWAVLRFQSIRWKAYLPLLLVVLQSLLGWATFAYKLPTITTVLHLIFSLLFLSSLEATRPLQFDPALKTQWNPKWKDVVGFFLFFLVLQFILGGILRKSSLLAACEENLDFLACWSQQAQIPLAGSLSLLHRILGLFITFAGFFVFSYLIKQLPKCWKWAGMAGLVLMGGQLLLGLLMGRSASRDMIILHFTLGLLIFCILLYLIVRLRRAEQFFFGRQLPTYLNDLMDLFKPKLTILVVVTLVVGVLLAPAQMNIIYLVISLVAIWFQAAGSLSLNCYLEREVDKHMERTRDRPLPAGRLQPVVALYWGWGLILLGTIILMLIGNLLTAALGLFAALSYIYLYTPLKQKSPYALYVGALPGAIPTVMGWTLVTGTLYGMGAYLFGILFLWQIPHFMAISIYRKNEYSEARILTFAQTHSARFLKLNIIIYSLILLFYGLLPFWWQWRGAAYGVASLLLGVVLAGHALWSGLCQEQVQFHAWSRAYFFLTIFYLPLQLGLLLVLR
jgi:heme o synthase